MEFSRALQDEVLNYMYILPKSTYYAGGRLGQ